MRVNDCDDASGPRGGAAASCSSCACSAPPRIMLRISRGRSRDRTDAASASRAHTARVGGDEPRGGRPRIISQSKHLKGAQPRACDGAVGGCGPLVIGLPLRRVEELQRVYFCVVFLPQRLLFPEVRRRDVSSQLMGIGEQSGQLQAALPSRARDEQLTDRQHVLCKGRWQPTRYLPSSPAKVAPLALASFPSSCGS
jgi:hypothetical protein